MYIDSNRLPLKQMHKKRRLEQLRRSQQERLADETGEQRASRPEQLRRSQQERLADETEEQREVRLQQHRSNSTQFL